LALKSFNKYANGIDKQQTIILQPALMYCIIFKKDQTEQALYPILQTPIQAFSTSTEDNWHLLLPHLEIKTIQKNELLIVTGNKALMVGFCISMI